jgi:CHAT domain-containing protein
MSIAIFSLAGKFELPSLELLSATMKTDRLPLAAITLLLVMLAPVSPKQLLRVEAAAQAQTASDRKAESIRLNNEGAQLIRRAQYQAALEKFLQALAIAQEIKDRASEVAILINIGGMYDRLGQYLKALEFYQQALKIQRESSNSSEERLRQLAGEGDTLNYIGGMYYRLEQYPKALEFFQQALRIQQELGDSPEERQRKRAGEGATLNSIGAAYAKLRQYPQALEFYERALKIRQELDNLEGESITLNGIGAVYASLRQYSKALEFVQQSLKIAQEVGNPAEEGVALNNIGLLHLLSNNATQAEKPLLEAITVWESLRPGLTDENKISLFETQAATYRYLQQSLIAQNKAEAALEIAERGRARAFVELLASRLEGTGDREQKAISPPNIQQIRQIAKAQNATLVEYSVIENQALYIWVVKPSGDMTFKSVDLKPVLQKATLAELVSAVRYEDVRVRSIAVVPIPNAEQNRELIQIASLKTLHQLLIAPIAEQLPNDPNQRVIFIPQDALFLVPFAALQAPDGKYLVEKHTILTAPSIQTLELTRAQKLGNRRQKTGGALIVGNPVMPQVTQVAGQDPIQWGEIPGTEKEAKALGQLFKVPALIGSQATEAVVKAQMPQAKLIHLATHGLFDDERGLGSAIALTPTSQEDGLLTAEEILDLKLQAELVVLSACDTGRGKITGDGVIGLSRSLISAGVPSVIVSLWAVPDSPTASLMVRFYRNLEQNPDKAQALRQAMLQTKENHPSPRDWAAFTLIGETN